ncbi:MAG: DUF1232 domain-containing protein [Chitinophagaceae bacterium]|nr:DUF1232 domain-containing protein [Chitinophagaceae bacterium]
MAPRLQYFINDQSQWEIKWRMMVKKLFTFYYALKDEGAPWHAKFAALLAIIYLISPIDIVPDIIPLAGYIDDAVIVPFLIGTGLKLLPADVRVRAEQKAKKNNRKLLWAKIAVIVLLIVVLTAVFLLVK